QRSRSIDRAADIAGQERRQRFQNGQTGRGLEANEHRTWIGFEKNIGAVWSQSEVYTRPNEFKLPRDLATALLLLRRQFRHSDFRGMIVSKVYRSGLDLTGEDGVANDKSTDVGARNLILKSHGRDTETQQIFRRQFVGSQAPRMSSALHRLEYGPLGLLS